VGNLTERQARIAFNANAFLRACAKNYFLWMNEQYGLKKLIEHIWKVIGIASTCSSMDELELRMEELYGKRPGFQFELKLVAPAKKDESTSLS